MRSKLAAALLSAGLTGATLFAIGVPATPAQAITVFDPSNYSQNILTAARSLQQIDNQIRMLQNQAQSLINQARNLATIDFPELQAITRTLQQIDQLMGEAQGVQFRVAGLDQQLRSLYPANFGQALAGDQGVAAARSRLDASVAAFRRTMTVQAQVAENVQADGTTLSAIVARSQGAQGALQAGQATNQLLALATKQQFQIQTLMAAQYRAEALEQARRAQAETDAQSAAARFLGSGSAYTPHQAQ